MTSETMKSEKEVKPPKRIYVASSWRNEFQQNVVAMLRNDGHAVYDFKGDGDGWGGVGGGPGGFSWKEIDPVNDWQKWTPQQYIAALDHPRALEGFNRDMDALKSCDVCVFVMPCGPSASMEMGWAAGAGRKVVAYIPAMREPDLMVKMADVVTDDLAVVLSEVRRPLVQSLSSPPPKARERIVALIVEERERQDAQWGGPEHDDQHTAEEWYDFRRKFEWRMFRPEYPNGPELLVKIAALAIAQCESYWRISDGTDHQRRDTDLTRDELAAYALPPVGDVLQPPEGLTNKDEAATALREPGSVASAFVMLDDVYQVCQSGDLPFSARQIELAVKILRHALQSRSVTSVTREEIAKVLYEHDIDALRFNGDAERLRVADAVLDLLSRSSSQ
jgi:hypothetical protein